MQTVTRSTRLARLRRERKLTLRAVAKACNCSHVAVLHWERGQVVPQRRFRPTLEAIFGLPIEELLKPDDKATVVGPTTAARV